MNPIADELRDRVAELEAALHEIDNMLPCDEPCDMGETQRCLHCGNNSAAAGRGSDLPEPGEAK